MTGRVALGSVLIVLDLFLLVSNASPLIRWVALVMLIPLGILVFRRSKSSATSSKAKAVLGIRSARGDRKRLWTSIAGLTIGVVGPALELWWLSQVCGECF